jgi:threonine aldolase
MLEGNLWLDLATQANRTAKALAQVLKANGADLLLPVEGNEVFARLDDAQVNALKAADIGFFPWQGLGRDAYRFVTSWQSDAQDVAAVEAIVASNS